MSRITIPLLVTHDLEIAPDHDAAGQRQALARLSQDLDVPVTMFATASAAESLTGEVRQWVRAGHEVGCHGVDHGADENLRTAGNRSASIIGEATARLLASVGVTPRCFRGPFSSTSVAAQVALVQHGYLADFSVCSGRIDFLASLGGTPAWLSAPRTPYRPHATSPFRRGDVPIWVVPLSAWGIPFVSGAMYLAGLEFMKRFFDRLHRESTRTGKPIVYLFHSYEFAEPLQHSSAGRRVPRKQMHRLYDQDRGRRYANTLRLIDYMTSAPDVVPMTGTDFVTRYALQIKERLCTSS